MKKKHIFYVLQLFATAAALYTDMACTRIYYHPNMHNVPMLREKGDLKANLALSQGNEVAAIEAQAAYAIKEHTGLMLNYIGAQASGGLRNGRGAYLEGGAGYFKGLGKYGVFEVYGGGGAGSIANFRAYNDKKPFYPIYFAKAFAQPSIGFQSKIFDAAFSCRLGTVYYFPYSAPDSAHLYNLQGAYLIENKAYTYIEPALTLRAGYKYAKFQTQLGMTNIGLPRDVAASNLNFNVGIYTDIAAMTKAWNRKKK